jgi:hypothetical protein
MSKRALPMMLAAVFALAGCGLRGPYAHSPHRAPSAASVAARAPLTDGALGAARGASSVLARFATSWVNWSAATLAREREVLLALAAGQLAAQLRRDAAQAVRNRLEEVSQAYSRGRYVGLIRQAGGGAVVLTYEEVALASGQPQGAYHVYLAHVEVATHGWRVTQWQPATDG